MLQPSCFIFIKAFRVAKSYHFSKIQSVFETMQLRLGLGPTVIQLRSHTWSQDLMKLGFFMSHHRKNSVRNKVIGKKWIFFFKRECTPQMSVSHLRRRGALGETLHRQECGPFQMKGTKIWHSQYLWPGQSHRLMSVRIILAILGERVRISRNWATIHFLAFYD